MKENKIEKLILDLSAAWECSPEEVVDRLNSMNESEINKLINSMTKKFLNGGLMDCLRAGGNLTECKKCGGKAPIKAQKGEKMLRTDGVSGYAYRKSDGTLVLTRDGKGPVPLPGSSYQMPGYEPPMSTEMRVETDKGGKPVRYEVDVYEGDESLLPYRTYSSDPSWWQFTRRRLTKEALQRYIDAYKANGLLRNGGKVTSKPDSSKYVNKEKEWGKSQKTSGIEKSDSAKNEKYVDLRKKLPLNKQITKPIPGIKK